MGNLQNSSIASFAVSAQQENGGSGVFYVFNGRNGNWPGLLNFTLDGTTQGFTANGNGGQGAGQLLIIGGDFDKDGNTDIITTDATAKIFDIYREPNPLNTPLNLGGLNGVNGGNILSPPSSLGRSAAIIDINNDGNPDLAVAMQGILLVLGQPSVGLPPQLNLATANSSYVNIIPGVVATDVNTFGGTSGYGGGLVNLGDITGNGREVLGATAYNTGIGTVYFLFPYSPTCTTPPSSTTPTGSTTSGTTSPSNSSSNNLGAIIGGVVGGVVLVAGVVTLVFLKVKKIGPFAESNTAPLRHNKANALFNDL